MKIYCIFSKESLKKMNGIRGKMTSQAGHAFLHSFWNVEEFYPDDAEDYKNSDHAKKITLVCDTDEQLIELYDYYIRICGVTKVVDSGFTVFKKPTLTCIGIGPIKDESIENNIKELKLLT